MQLTKTYPDICFGPEWTEEYIEQNIDRTQNAVISSNSEQFQISEDFKREYLELQPDILEFMKEYDINQQRRHLDSLRDDNTILNKVEEELEAAGTWTNEFIKEDASSENADFNHWEELEKQWEKLDNTDFFPFSMSNDSASEVYEFQQTNPMKDLPNALEEGKKRLKMGDLPSAVLCFEAAVQQEENNPEAWYLLGRAQAENEQDPFAIPALRRCLDLDPMNGAALMALAICYTNECQQRQACIMLKEWLLKNEKYKHLVAESSEKLEQHPGSPSILLDNALRREVQQLYIQAARMNPHVEIDPDVQCGLGVLLTLMSEYEKAADCFQAALGVRPEDPGLWNRWGATLANGQRSAEAIDAYRRALELSPGFIRARYNLGISCINLGAHAQAAEHLLIALNQQASGKDTEGKTVSFEANMSRTIWSTLRLVVALMDKVHLIESVENRNLQKLNEEFGIVWNPHA
ncbi:Peroxisomal targeting signal 1 receptor [Harpegnathos saltator]|uniref:Peroxisomal targeting signal 1 receptor n=2 Tax=Harpegnathos saltator TaxID=610380 RepID=E2B3H7_HARSA|nr:Peroxisomal targeting signal 1 receptor [Harpegnathos saltator]